MYGLRSEMSTYCGRLDPHPSHSWLGQDWPNMVGLTAPRVARQCPGRPLIEGGNPAALTWPLSGGDNRPCEVCEKSVHLPHDPACPHGHVVCDFHDFAEVCGWCAEAAEREALDELGEVPC